MIKLYLLKKKKKSFDGKENVSSYDQIVPPQKKRKKIPLIQSDKLYSTESKTEEQKFLSTEHKKLSSQKKRKVSQIQPDNCSQESNTKEQNLILTERCINTELLSDSKEKKRRPILPRISIPIYGASVNMIDQLSSSLAQATIESGYDELESPIISKLPNDIILIIFRFLIDSTDLLSVACVSKRWSILASDSDLWKTLYEYYYGTISDSDFISENSRPFLLRSYKFNFQKRRKEFQSQADAIRSYSRRKKHFNLPTTPNFIIAAPVVYKKTPKNNSSSTDTRPNQQNYEEDPQLLALLEQKRQFFDSFGSISLVTTPRKKPRRVEDPQLLALLEQKKTIL